MSGYPVHQLNGSARLVIVLQYPQLDTEATVLVAPLYPAKKALELKVLTPKVEIGGEEFLIATHLLAAVQKTQLGRQEALLTAYDYPIANALNRLFFGI